MAMPKAFVPIICGIAALILGFSPGLLSSLFIKISTFRDSLFRHSPWPLPQQPPPVPRELDLNARSWFLIFAVGFIALGLYAAVSNRI